MLLRILSFSFLEFVGVSSPIADQKTLGLLSLEHKELLR